MTNEEIKKVYLKVRNFLNECGYSDGIGFDLRSYDNEEDIPHITHNEERRKVSFFQARGKDNISVVLEPYWHEVIININFMDADELYTLLQDAYYETAESNKIGDFEEDFLK